ncbi:MAG: hypothetical protein FWG68_07710 [Defluviitaleaceae bacterium]|nr:hypothetical protein [Defluviitaleaceae bacterium]
MRIPTARLFENANNPLISQNNPLTPNVNRRTNRNSIRDSIIQSRINEQQTEQKIREREDERIAEINDRINGLRNRLLGEEDVNRKEALRNNIGSLEGQINEIRNARAKREELQAERELERQQMLIEEMTRAAEIPEQQEEEPKDEEEAEEMRQRNTVRSLTIISSAMDRVSTLRQSLTRQQSEAGQLSRAMSSENSNYTKIGYIYRAQGLSEIIPSEQAGFGGTDFRNQQLERLNQGTSRTNVAIQSAISTIYRESQQTQESQLAANRQEEQEEQNREDNENSQNQYFEDYQV